MDKNNLPGLSPLWLISLAMTLGVFLSVAVPLIVSVNTINATAWIGFSGSLIGGVVAILALLVATRNVRRQMRVSLLSREEERMEEVLSGLREIAAYLGGILAKMRSINGQSVAATIDTYRIRGNIDDLAGRLAKIVPNADEHSAQQLRVMLEKLHETARKMELVDEESTTIRTRYLREKEAGVAGPEIETMVRQVEMRQNNQVDKMRTGIKNLREFEMEVLRRIKQFETRLPLFRRSLL
jgi:hypothetical protein